MNNNLENRDIVLTPFPAVKLFLVFYLKEILTELFMLICVNNNKGIKHYSRIFSHLSYLDSLREHSEGEIPYDLYLGNLDKDTIDYEGIIDLFALRVHSEYYCYGGDILFIGTSALHIHSEYLYGNIDSYKLSLNDTADEIFYEYCSYIIRKFSELLQDNKLKDLIQIADIIISATGNKISGELLKSKNRSINKKETMLTPYNALEMILEYYEMKMHTKLFLIIYADNVNNSWYSDIFSYLTYLNSLRTYSGNKNRKVPYRMYFNWLWDNFDGAFTCFFIKSIIEKEFKEISLKEDNPKVFYDNYCCKIMKKFSRILADNTLKDINQITEIIDLAVKEK